MLWRPLPDVLVIKLYQESLNVTRDGRLETFMENVRTGRPASRSDPAANFYASNSGYNIGLYKGTHERGYIGLIEDPSLPRPTTSIANEAHHQAVWDLAHEHGLITDDL